MNTECVVLAAGLSSRAGANKMLLKINGRTVLERCIGAFYGSCSKIIVVTGHRHEEIAGLLSSYEKVSPVYNESFKNGMFSSVKTGIAAINSERFFLIPGDYPLIDSATIELMLGVDGSFVVPAYRGLRGHPLLLHRSLIPSILLSGADSLRECLRDEKRIDVIVDDIGVVTDLDTLEDYEKILAIAKGLQC